MSEPKDAHDWEHPSGKLRFLLDVRTNAPNVLGSIDGVRIQHEGEPGELRMVPAAENERLRGLIRAVSECGTEIPVALWAATRAEGGQHPILKSLLDARALAGPQSVRVGMARGAYR